MAQEFTREKLSVADAFGNPVYIGNTKTTIHTVPANSQDTITLYLKFGRTARCEVTLFRSDGTNDYELPTKYLGASNSIVPVEITNVQAGNTIKAQLSGASPNTKIYVTSGEISNAYTQLYDDGSNWEILIFTDKFQTGTPRRLTIDDFNWGSYTAPTNFTWVQTVKYFPDTGHLVFAKSSGTGSGWWVYDVYEDRVAFYTSSMSHTATEYGVTWLGSKAVFFNSSLVIVVDFSDRTNPSYTTTSPSTYGQPLSHYKISSDIVGTNSANSSYPQQAFKINSDNTATLLDSYSSINNSTYFRYAAELFANGNFYVAKSHSGTGLYYAGIVQFDTSTNQFATVTNAISGTYDSRYTNIVVACPERNEFWFFSNTNGSYDIGKYDLATSTLSKYTNSRAVADTNGARAFYDASTDLIWVQTGDKYIGYDPDTQSWTRDSLSMTDYDLAGSSNRASALYVINNGTNDFLIGSNENTAGIRYYNLDTQSEAAVSGNATYGWNFAKHNATNTVYACGQNSYLDYFDFDSGTPSYTNSLNGGSITGFSNYWYHLQVDQTNNHLYATDYNASLHKIDINASTGNITHNSIVNQLSATTFRESPKVVDITNQRYIVFYSTNIYWYDMSTNATSYTQITLSNSGIDSGLGDYSSAFSFYSDSSSTYGISGCTYDSANNVVYVPFRYNNGTTYKMGLIKLDLSHIGGTESNIYSNHYILENSSSYPRVNAQFELQNNRIAAGTTTNAKQWIVNVSTGEITQVSPETNNGTVYARYYDSGTSSVYYNMQRYTEGQKVAAPAGESPITNDFEVEYRQNYNSTNQAIIGYRGLNTHTDNDYNDSTLAQRNALDLAKGNSVTGHVNRVTTTA